MTNRVPPRAMTDQELWPTVQVMGGAPTRMIEWAIQDCERRVKTYQEVLGRLRVELAKRSDRDD